MDAPLTDRIHAFWDELADFDAARVDAALDRLLGFLCELVDAQNANWFGAVRMADIVPGDPTRGWRPGIVHYLHPSRPLDAKARELAKKFNQGDVDETAVRNISLAGTFRANRLVDLASESWFESDYYRVYYAGVGHVDVIWAGVPINADAECYFGILRDGAHARFTPEERDLVAYTLRGLKWFCRRQMLGHGLLIASSPLTPAERSVLQGLLGGESEKQVAAALDKSYHTIHEHVAAIFRKFDVTNRAALMALWLGRAS